MFLVLNKIFGLYFVGYTLATHDNSDCLFNQNLHHMTSSQDSDYEDCKKWCADNNDCGGFAGAGDDCYFKRLACKDAVLIKANAHLYLKKMA